MSRGSAVELKKPDEIAKMRVACGVTARCHALVREIARPGVSLREIDAECEKLVRGAGLVPAFQGVVAPGAPFPFPGTVCTSVNDAVVHGLPSDYVLKDGDILKADTGAIHQGWYSDAAITVPIGTVSAEAQRLIDVTHEALMRAIRLMKPGVRLRKLCAAIQDYVERENRLWVVKEYVGHGLGRSLWEPPQVPNYIPRWGGRELDMKLEPGLVLAIEPMVNIGTEAVETSDDGWTVRTKDGSLSAHFEHDVLVTETGYEILTLLENHPQKFG